ncbi:hypothetical protein SRRS_53690 [Sporomusa rhizae]|uniref:hypothetical protein n=1 Tax=Sporomusa rhizae TaxID=357999 RepID=UPI00352BCDFF
MVNGSGETLIQKLTTRIQEQLIINGITDFKCADGNFYFENTDEKSKANDIIRNWLIHFLENDAEHLM